MDVMRKAETAGERKTIEDVENHGWHVLKVMEDDRGPGFAYTIGLHHSFRHPELICSSASPLTSRTTYSILLVKPARRGRQFSEGAESDEVLEDRVCRFRRVPVAQYQNYMGWDLWFYQGQAFPALQIRLGR